MSLRQGMLDDVGIQQDHVDCASVSDLSTDEEKSYEPPEFLTYSELGVQIEDITSESDKLHINTGGFVDCFARRTWAKPSTNEGGPLDLTKNSWIAELENSSGVSLSPCVRASPFLEHFALFFKRISHHIHGKYAWSIARRLVNILICLHDPRTSTLKDYLVDKKTWAIFR